MGRLFGATTQAPARRDAEASRPRPIGHQARTRDLPDPPLADDATHAVGPGIRTTMNFLDTFLAWLLGFLRARSGASGVPPLRPLPTPLAWPACNPLQDRRARVPQRCLARSRLSSDDPSRPLRTRVRSQAAGG